MRSHKKSMHASRLVLFSIDDKKGGDKLILVNQYVLLNMQRLEGVEGVKGRDITSKSCTCVHVQRK